jgi:hypothetical protein
MTFSSLPTRAWKINKILFSDKVYKRAGDHPPFSVNKTPSDKQHLCVGRAITQEEE